MKLAEVLMLVEASSGLKSAAEELDRNEMRDGRLGVSCICGAYWDRFLVKRDREHRPGCLQLEIVALADKIDARLERFCDGAKGGAA